MINRIGLWATAVATGVFALSTAALAADMPVKAPPSVPVVAAYNWTGFYVGFNVGYAWEDRTVTFTGNDAASIPALTGAFAGGTPAGPANFSINGATGGFQAGYNYRASQRWVVGIEADFSGSRIKGDGSNTSILVASRSQTISADQNITWYGTIRARLGWLAADSLLVYGTAGFAYGRVKENVVHGGTLLATSSALGGFSFLCSAGFVPCLTGASVRTATGWTAGAGAEYAVTANVSVKADYLYVNLGSSNVNVVALATSPGTTASSFTAKYSTLDFHTVRVGLNYRFGGPVVARY